jgi:hypothetical protein
VGGSTTLSAESRDSTGRKLGPGVIWWASTDPSIASVDSTTGVVQAVAPGRVQIIATAGVRRDSARIVVRPASREPAPEPASLSIANHDSLRVGDTVTLSLSALDQRGRPLRRIQVSWSSSEPSVASIDAGSGTVHAHAPGHTVIIARAGSESAISSFAVVPASVASVDIGGARPLKVGDTLELRADTRDAHGRSLAGRTAVWASSNPKVASVDSASGVVLALAAGNSEISAQSEGQTGKVRVTVLPQPRTSRVEPVAVEPESRQAAPSSPEDPAAERQRMLGQLKDGVDQCYQALANKDVSRVELLYRPESKTDRENLKRLGRILRTSEWAAQVGGREDGAQRLVGNTAWMEFGFRLAWKDAFGGRLTSRPVFRADFVKDGDSFELFSCRIVGSPKL